MVATIVARRATGRIQFTDTTHVGLAAGSSTPGDRAACGEVGGECRELGPQRLDVALAPDIEREPQLRPQPREPQQQVADVAADAALLAKETRRFHADVLHRRPFRTLRRPGAQSMASSSAPLR